MKLPRLTYANVVATMALFVALGGGAYAATQLEKNSVGPSHIQPRAVAPRHVSKPLASDLADAVAGPINPPRGNTPCAAYDANDPTCVNYAGETKTLGTLITKTWLLSCPDGLIPQGIPYPAVFLQTNAPKYTGEGTFDALKVIFTATNWSSGKQQMTPYMPCSKL